MIFGPIFPIFGEDFSFPEELAAHFGDFSRQSLRDQAMPFIVVANCAIAGPGEVDRDRVPTLSRTRPHSPQRRARLQSIQDQLKLVALHDRSR
jgi:hypothetical protein